MKKELVQDKGTPEKKKFKFQTLSDSSLESVEANQATKKDANNQHNHKAGSQMKRLGFLFKYLIYFNLLKEIFAKFLLQKELNLILKMK
jgi:hypothetical protein